MTLSRRSLPAEDRATGPARGRRRSTASRRRPGGRWIRGMTGGSIPLPDASGEAFQPITPGNRREGSMARVPGGENSRARVPGGMAGRALHPRGTDPEILFGYGPPLVA